GGRRRAAGGAAAAPAPRADQGGGSPAGQEGRPAGGRGADPSGVPQGGDPDAVRRQRLDREALSPAGRGRHAVRHHRGRPDAGGRHGHGPGPGHPPAAAGSGGPGAGLRARTHPLRVMDPELVRRVEAFSVEVGREQYRARAGRTTRPALAEVYERYADLFRTDTISAVADAERATTGDARRRLRALREFLVTSAAERAGAEVRDRRLAWEAEKQLYVAGQAIPFRQAVRVLADAEDPEERRAIWAARVEALREVEPLDRDRFERDWEVFRLAGGGLPEAWEALTGIELAPLAESAREVLAETEAIYRDLLTYVLPRRLGITLAHATAADRSRLERAPWFDVHFAVEDPVAVARRQLAEIGWELEAGGRVALDLEARPAKSPRAFCAVIRVPDEIVLVVSRTGGWRDWYAFYHELGHAQHFARVDASLPFEDRA